MVQKLKLFGQIWDIWAERRGNGGRVGRIGKVFAFGISLTPEIASSKKLHTGGRLASLAPGTLFLAKEDMWMCQSFLTFLGPNSDCQGYSGHFLGLFWGGARAAKVNLLTFFWGVCLINFLKTYPKISHRIEEGEEICSNYLDDPETTYCSRSSRQVLSKRAHLDINFILN